MQVQFRHKYYTGLADIRFAVYATNPECIALRIVIPLTEEVVAIPTVNLEDYDMVPKENHVFIKDYSEGAEMYNALRDAGVVKPNARKFTFGQFEAACFEAELTNEAIKAMTNGIGDSNAK